MCCAGASGGGVKNPEHSFAKEETRVRRDGYHREIGNNRTLGHSENV